MENSLVVFQEQGVYLGLFPSDFEHYFQLNSVWIYPSVHSMLVWKYERSGKPKTGSFIHMGSLVGSSPAIFSQNGYIFEKKIHRLLTMGLFLNEILFEIPLKKIGKTTEIDQIRRLPTDIPPSVFRYARRVKGRNILVIDPLLLFRAYNVI